MKCKACKREIPDESIFCLHCGAKLVRSRGKSGVVVPVPRRQKNGTWWAEIMDKGVRYTIKGETEAEYYARAEAFKAGLIEAKNRGKGKQTLARILKDYIDSVEDILSPATIRGYRIVERNRFQSYMDKPVDTIDFQRMLADEARKKLSPKSIVNAWGLVTAALKAAGIDRPEVKRPQLPGSDEDFLDFKEIKKFVAAAEGDSAEAAVLLALHGLRTSEFMDLDVKQITKDKIKITGATVPNADNKYVHKETNKNDTSRREVPILIPRLLEILPESGKAVTIHPSSVRRGIQRICSKAGVTQVSAHDLRRSFASLAFHLKWDAETTRQLGGWKNLDVVNKIYRKLADADKQRDVKKMQKFYQK